MNTILRVSVVMPSYNHSRFIKESIESVLNQDYPHLDLLVMDGGSTDGTVDILKSYGTRLSFVSQKDNGQADAINRGLKRAEGEIVCWVNSDDLLASNAINVVVDIFRKYPGVDFVYGNGWTIDESGNMMGDSGVLPFDLWKLIHQRNFIQQPSCFFRRTLLDKVGFIDESLHYVMDWELWIRFSAYKGHYTKEFLSYNRTYSQNKTQSGFLKRLREIYKVVRKYTSVKWPPILFLYFLEIIILISLSKRIPKYLLGPLFILLGKGMKAEMSGCYPDGAIKPCFNFSVGNTMRKKVVKVTISPLSVSNPARLGNPPVSISWRSSSGSRGRLSILENGMQQEFLLPLGASESGEIVHFTCKADFKGLTMTGASDNSSQRIIGYLDGFNMQQLSSLTGADQNVKNSLL